MINKLRLNTRHTAKEAKHVPARIPDHTLGAHILAVAAEQGLYNVEACHDSGGIRITFAATFTPAEVDVLCLEYAPGRASVYGPSHTVRGIVSTAFTREATSK